MDRLKVGVIGCGSMGSNHIRVYADEPGRFELVGVCDNDKERMQAAAKRFHTTAFASVEELLDLVDAVSVVVPSSLHREVGMKVAEHGVHALIEKPLALKKTEAEELTAAFAQRNLNLQVGHIERFNPAFVEMEKLIDPHKVLYVETHRYGPYSGNGRITDASVVEDLMIHDIDLVCKIMNPISITKIHANGEELYSDIDFASAMLRFGNRAHAVISVSRVSQSKERLITVHTKDSCIRADLILKTVTVSRNTSMIAEGFNNSAYRQEGEIQQIFVPIQEPLRQELLSFYNVVMNCTQCPVPGAVGVEAVSLCEEVVKKIRARPATIE